MIDMMGEHPRQQVVGRQLLNREAIRGLEAGGAAGVVGIADPKVEGLRPQAIAFGKIAGEEGRDADGEISGKLARVD